MADARWLLLAHQLPARLSNARVKTWRRLQQVGAVPTRNSVYVLPNTEQCREDFEWIRSEIVALGGEATVFAAEALDAGGGDDIVTAFRRARDADYLRVRRDAERQLRAARGQRRLPPSARQRVVRAARALRDRFNAIGEIDYFSASTRQEAAEALEALERTVAERPEPDATAARPPLESFRGRRWVTRPRPGVDRMASAWLIRRFVDPHAVFAFVDRPADTDVPFDMYVGEFSHHGSLCTFETLAQRFGLEEVGAVPRLAPIVHDLDMRETRYAPPEAPAVGRFVEGLRQLHPDDHVLLEQGIAMFEALARSFESPDPARPAQTAARNRREPPGRGARSTRRS